MADNSIKGGLIAVVSTLIGSLLLGGYLYTWSADKEQTTEKKEWRSEHNRVLEKSLQEIKETQKQTAQETKENQNQVRETLQKIFLEQQRKNK